MPSVGSTSFTAFWAFSSFSSYYWPYSCSGNDIEWRAKTTIPSLPCRGCTDNSGMIFTFKSVLAIFSRKFSFSNQFSGSHRALIPFGGSSDVDSSHFDLEIHIPDSGSLIRGPAVDGNSMLGTREQSMLHASGLRTFKPSILNHMVINKIRCGFLNNE